MFRRYDVASVDDKLEAIQKARAYAATRTAVGENVTPFPAELPTQQPHIEEKGQVPEGTWLGGRDSNPEEAATPEQGLPTDPSSNVETPRKI
jgi:hypothetical protein